MAVAPAVIIGLQILGTVAAAAGTAYGVYEGQKASSASQRAESLRKKQLQLEADAKRREQIRKFQLARATSVSNIQGATGSLEGSAYGGATSGLAAGLGTGLGELSQSESIGLGIFSANAQYAEAQAGQQLGSSIGQFGKDLFSSAPAIGRIGSTLFSPPQSGFTTTTERAY